MVGKESGDTEWLQILGGDMPSFVGSSLGTS